MQPFTQQVSATSGQQNSHGPLILDNGGLGVSSSKSPRSTGGWGDARLAQVPVLATQTGASQSAGQHGLIAAIATRPDGTQVQLLLEALPQGAHAAGNGLQQQQTLVGGAGDMPSQHAGFQAAGGQQQQQQQQALLAMASGLHNLPLQQALQQQALQQQQHGIHVGFADNASQPATQLMLATLADGRSVLVERVVNASTQLPTAAAGSVSASGAAAAAASTAGTPPPTAISLPVDLSMPSSSGQPAPSAGAASGPNPAVDSQPHQQPATQQATLPLLQVPAANLNAGVTSVPTASPNSQAPQSHTGLASAAAMFDASQLQSRLSHATHMHSPTGASAQLPQGAAAQLSHSRQPGPDLQAQLQSALRHIQAPNLTTTFSVVAQLLMSPAGDLLLLESGPAMPPLSHALIQTSQGKMQLVPANPMQTIPMSVPAHEAAAAAHMQLPVPPALTGHGPGTVLLQAAQAGVPSQAGVLQQPSAPITLPAMSITLPGSNVPVPVTQIVQHPTNSSLMVALLSDGRQVIVERQAKESDTSAGAGMANQDSHAARMSNSDRADMYAGRMQDASGGLAGRISHLSHLDQQQQQHAHSYVHPVQQQMMQQRKVPPRIVVHQAVNHPPAAKPLVIPHRNPQALPGSRLPGTGHVVKKGSSGSQQQFGQVVVPPAPLMNALDIMADAAAAAAGDEDFGNEQDHPDASGHRQGSGDLQSVGADANQKGEGLTLSGRQNSGKENLLEWSGSVLLKAQADDNTTQQTLFSLQGRVPPHVASLLPKQLHIMEFRKVADVDAEAASEAPLLLTMQSHSASSHKSQLRKLWEQELCMVCHVNEDQALLMSPRQAGDTFVLLALLMPLPLPSPSSVLSPTQAPLPHQLATGPHHAAPTLFRHMNSEESPHAGTAGLDASQALKLHEHQADGFPSKESVALVPVADAPGSKSGEDTSRTVSADMPQQQHRSHSGPQSGPQTLQQLNQQHQQLVAGMGASTAQTAVGEGELQGPAVPADAPRLAARDSSTHAGGPFKAQDSGDIMLQQERAGGPQKLPQKRSSADAGLAHASDAQRARLSESSDVSPQPHSLEQQPREPRAGVSQSSPDGPSGQVLQSHGQAHEQSHGQPEGQAQGQSGPVLQSLGQSGNMEAALNTGTAQGQVEMSGSPSEARSTPLPGPMGSDGPNNGDAACNGEHESTRVARVTLAHQPLVHESTHTKPLQDSLGFARQKEQHGDPQVLPAGGSSPESREGSGVTPQVQSVASKVHASGDQDISGKGPQQGEEGPLRGLLKAWISQYPQYQPERMAEVEVPADLLHSIQQDARHFMQHVRTEQAVWRRAQAGVVEQEDTWVPDVASRQQDEADEDALLRVFLWLKVEQHRKQVQQPQPPQQAGQQKHQQQQLQPQLQQQQQQTQQHSQSQQLLQLEQQQQHRLHQQPQQTLQSQQQLQLQQMEQQQQQYLRLQQLQQQQMGQQQQQQQQQLNQHYQHPQQLQQQQPQHHQQLLSQQLQQQQMGQQSHHQLSQQPPLQHLHQRMELHQGQQQNGQLLQHHRQQLQEQLHM